MQPAGEGWVEEGDDDVPDDYPEDPPYPDAPGFGDEDGDVDDDEIIYATEGDYEFAFLWQGQAESWIVWYRRKPVPA